MKTLSLICTIVIVAATGISAEDTKGIIEVPSIERTTATTHSLAETITKVAPRIEAVFVIDTTGSMGGLIQAAKEKVWAICNTLATSEPAPDIQIGLVGYRDRSDTYITHHVQLDSDLDKVYTELMGFQAAGGGDTPESVNQALHEAVTKMQWSPDENVYKVLFLVGDCPPHMDYQDDVKYPESCKLAAEKGITINTIQCGSHTDTIPIWRDIAKKAEGQYFQVEQSGSAVLATTPFDTELAELSRQMDATRVYYGTQSQQLRQLRRNDSSDKLYTEASVSAVAQRAVFNSSKSGISNFIGGNELVNDIENGTVDLDTLQDEELNEQMKEMTKDERKQYIEKQSESRKQITQKINDLSQKRQEYIKNELQKQQLDGQGTAPNLDTLIYECIRKQAAEKGIEYNEGPKF